jgi:hypothetical protein
VIPVIGTKSWSRALSTTFAFSQGLCLHTETRRL